MTDFRSLLKLSPQRFRLDKLRHFSKWNEISLGTFIWRLIEECLKVWDERRSGFDFWTHWFSVRGSHSKNQNPIDTLRLTFSIQKSYRDFMPFFLTIAGSSDGFKWKVAELCYSWNESFPVKVSLTRTEWGHLVFSSGIQWEPAWPRPWSPGRPPALPAYPSTAPSLTPPHTSSLPSLGQWSGQLVRQTADWSN